MQIALWLLFISSSLFYQKYDYDSLLSCVIEISEGDVFQKREMVGDLNKLEIFADNSVYSTLYSKNKNMPNTLQVFELFNGDLHGLSYSYIDNKISSIGIFDMGELTHELHFNKGSIVSDRKMIFQNEKSIKEVTTKFYRKVKVEEFRFYKSDSIITDQVLYRKGKYCCFSQ